MNGVHDLGGMHGFGPIEREANEPLFHDEWEKHVFAIIILSTFQHGYLHWDTVRSAIERMAPADYLRSTYYERWRAAAERCFLEAGALTEAELDAKTELLTRDPGRAPMPSAAAALLTPTPGKNFPLPLQTSVTPRFAVDDVVVARNINPVGHTRLPRYARGKRGAIHRVHDGLTLLPDTNAAGVSEDPQVVYSVRFEGRELWGDTAEPGQMVYLDLFDSYLDPAPVEEGAR